MQGDIKTATEIAASLQPIREFHAKWIMGYWHRGRLPMAEMKYWQELIGMNGGPIRPPLVEMTDTARTEMRADLEATGLLERAQGGARVAAE